jgi:hypothetical protein
MRGLADIHLDVRGGDIILAAYLPAKDDARTGLTQAEFLARAWRLANDKARELDWIV